jgi:hypothetical protein
LREKCERAYSFGCHFCDGPDCGVHLTAYRKNGKPICEVTMTTEQNLVLIEYCQKHLYDKATQKED